jgi:sirohydrochlorin cobaltochelatase
MARALVLFAHGARAASWAEPFERLRTLTASRMPGTIVRLAFLELMTPQLPALVAELVQDGVDSLAVVPVFLGQGGHVLRDLPLMIEQLRLDYPALAIHVAGAVGEDPTVMQAMSDYCVAAAGQG